MMPLGAPLFGVYYSEGDVPQKTDLAPPIERQYKPFQVHVSFYIPKISPGWFVWPVQTVPTANLDKDRTQTVESLKI
jgi:hypothetical protein